MKKVLFILCFSLIPQYIQASEAKPKAADGQQFKKFNELLSAVSETQKAAPAFELPAKAEAAYQTYCAERRKLPNPNILTRKQFMDPQCPQT
jgi:hypothetical protein